MGSVEWCTVDQQGGRVLHAGGAVGGRARVVAGVVRRYGLDGQQAVPRAHALRRDALGELHGAAVQTPGHVERQVAACHVARQLHAVPRERLRLERERRDVRRD